MELLATVIALGVGVFVGYKIERIETYIKNVKIAVESTTEKPKEEPKSIIIDELDVEQQAIYEHKQMMEKLNPPQ